MSKPSRYFTVSNWHEHQHYKDRIIPTWIKLYARLLRNFEFTQLPDAARAHLLQIWLLLSQQKDKKLPYDAGWIGHQISASEPVDLALLVEAGFLGLVPEEGATALTPGQNASSRDTSRGSSRGGSSGSIPRSPLLSSLSDSSSEFDSESSSSGVNSRSSKAKKMPLPDDFALTPELRQFAIERRVNPNTQLAAMKDYAAANRWLKADWAATWRNWVRGAVRRGENNYQHVPTPAENEAILARERAGGAPTANRPVSLVPGVASEAPEPESGEARTVPAGDAMSIIDRVTREHSFNGRSR